METAKVSPKGQIVIPKELRVKFGIKPGSEVVVEPVKEGVLIMNKKKNPVKAMTGLFEGKFTKSSVEIIRDIRKEWDKRTEKFEKK